MRVHFLQHVAYEEPGAIGHWAEQRGHAITITRLFADQALPAVDAVDFMVVLGGPMNAYEIDTYPWLSREKAFIHTCLARGKPVLGICLGAQLMADVLGVKVVVNPQEEIGWHPVHVTPFTSGSNLTKGWPQSFMALHWHAETFGIPALATHLAFSQGCRHQAFQYGRCALALQFHLEFTLDSARTMVQACSQSLVAAPFVQRAEQIEAGMVHIPQAHQILFATLDAMQEAAAVEKT